MSSPSQILLLSLVLHISFLLAVVVVSKILPPSLVLRISFLLGVFLFSISGMTRSQNHDDGASSSGKRPKSCAPWSELDHNLLFSVTMQLGFVDFFSFRGVCKSWRSLACENQNKFMESMPPMHMSISWGTHEKTCHLEDFEGRRFKTIIPHSAVGACVGLTCGYLIFFQKFTRDFWLVNPITRHQLHFPDSPMLYRPVTIGVRAILVFSPSTSGLVFVVLYMSEFWFSVVGKGTWNPVPHSFHIYDLCAFKGKIYILIHDRDTPYHLCELKLSPQPKLTLLKIKMPDSFVCRLLSSGEKLYAMNSLSRRLKDLHELDLGEMKWVKACDKTTERYSFFHSDLFRDFVAVKQESWAESRSQSFGRFAFPPDTNDDGETTSFSSMMWYFPHDCMSVDRIDD